MDNHTIDQTSINNWEVVEHVKGSSIFIDSLPMRQDEVHVGVILSPQCRGKIRTIDFSAILTLPGFVGTFTAKDFASNFWGPIVQDTAFLAMEEVHYAGEPVALIVFTDKNSLRRAKKLVRIIFDGDENTLEPAILTIDQAIEHNSFLAEPMQINQGDVKIGFAESDHIISRQFRIQGQEHFYFETQAAQAIPDEGGCLKILSSTQHPTEVQHVCAHALGLSYHQVTCEVRRMGGGFGGKESQASHIAALAALVAYKLGRPARLILEREEDMELTGKRHGYFCRYKVGFAQDGKIRALDVQLYSDGGFSLDLSPAVLQRSLLHLDNCYFIPHFLATGTICRTHTAPNTAFRGFGGPQGMAVIENIMEEIGLKLGLDSLAIRKVNLYGAKPDYIYTPYGQKLENNLLPKLFTQLEKTAQYQERRRKVDEFNKDNKVLVRGLALTGCKFGISFTTRFLNQGNALVNIQRDGTVQVSTGATEMGQGVNLKIQGLVAEAFGLSPSHVRVMASSTEKNANTSPTAASSGSDINGAAAVAACEKIKERLANIAKQILSRTNPLDALEELEVSSDVKAQEMVFNDGAVYNPSTGTSISFKDLVIQCYLNRISLCDYAHYKYPGIGFNTETGKGQPFFYFTQGAAVSEVVLDRFTGEVKVLRTDILMDLGRLINPRIDYGQVSGGFVQGLGWVTSEDVYREHGRLIARSPTTYKIPNINDIPRQFNIDFLENKDNHKNIRGSKAVGEPPLPLALSVWCAVKNALSYQYPGKVPLLKVPASNEAIVMVTCENL